MPTKTKKSPIVDLSNKLRKIMCDRVEEIIEEKYEDDPTGDWDFDIALAEATKVWKKMGIVCEWVDALVGLEATHEAVEFSNKHYGSVIVLLVSEATHDEEMELAMEGEGRIERVLVAAVPLDLAKKIVKKGSI